jgi:hypothetical protein
LIEARTTRRYVVSPGIVDPANDPAANIGRP